MYFQTLIEISLFLNTNKSDVSESINSLTNFLNNFIKPTNILIKSTNILIKPKIELKKPANNLTNTHLFVSSDNELAI